MMRVNTSRGERTRAPGRGGHLVCGLVGLGVVFALFAIWYSVIAALAAGTLGVLSSTAIVWLFVTAWLGLWLGMDMALVWARRRATA